MCWENTRLVSPQSAGKQPFQRGWVRPEARVMEWGMAHLLLSGSWAPTSRESLPLPGQAAPLLPDPMSRGDSTGGPREPASRLTGARTRVRTAAGRAADYTSDSLLSFLPSSPVP